MEQNDDHENACERYLLGELSELEQAQLEEAYFADDALFDRFLAVKDDLIDAYARGDLSGQKHERFEQHFLASEPRRRQVEETKGLIRAVTAHSTKTSRVSNDKLARRPNSGWRQFISETFTVRRWVWQGALALLLVTLAGSWLFVKRFQKERAVVPSVNENSSALVGNKPAQVNGDAPPVKPTTAGADGSPQPNNGNKETPPAMPSRIASLFLSPFSPRDTTGSNSLMLHPNTSAVRLRLALKGDDYQRYDVILRTVNGEQVLHRQGLKARSRGAEKSVTITLDPTILRRQDYIMTLSGLTADGQLEAIGDYYFRVERASSQSVTPPRK